MLDLGCPDKKTGVSEFFCLLSLSMKNSTMCPVASAPNCEHGEAKEE